ncbi:amidohydrolase [Kineococcus sp. DHX-1]|uniref:amidohydrolase n=1 Tax=Kineococcus sp. DHX-1 TaxID=3349638 RepID=UPI0036D3E0E9
MDHGRLVALRRDLHRHAEPGFCEIRTAWRVETELAGLPLTLRTGAQAMDLAHVSGYPDDAERARWADLAVAAGTPADRAAFFRDHGTAVVAEMTGNRPGPVWGLRCDMDALGVVESTGGQHTPHREGFRSTTGQMHACAHDGHTAIGVGLLHRLADRDFPGTLRLVFQPAEEGVRGARPMVAAGVVSGVDRMLAVHLGLDLPVGTVVGGATGALATTKFAVTFTGEAAHAAAAPERGRNALAAAASATLTLLGLPRHSAGETRVNVGTLHAGGGANIVPAQARLTFEVRGSTDRAHEDLRDMALRAVRGVAATYGVEATVEVSGAAAGTTPDESVIDLVELAAKETEGVRDFRRTHAMSGSDDATLFMHEVQRAGGTAAYVLVGGANPGPHHHAEFDVDEDCLAVAVDVLERVVRRG